MIAFDARPTSDLRPTNRELDFATSEDELPSAVMLTADGAFSRGTSITDVKNETTDDN